MAQRLSTRARLTSAAPLTHYARKADAPQLSTLGPHSALPQMKTFASCISLDNSTKLQHPAFSAQHHSSTVREDRDAGWPMAE